MFQIYERETPQTGNNHIFNGKYHTPCRRYTRRCQHIKYTKHQVDRNNNQTNTFLTFNMHLKSKFLSMSW